MEVAPRRPGAVTAAVVLGFLPWARRVAGTVVTSAPEEGVGVFPCYFIPVPHEQAADSNKPRAFVTP